MNDKDRFILDARDKLYVDEKNIENRMAHNQAAINDAYREVATLKASIDVNYSVLSASQTANDDVLSKIDYYEKLINEKQAENDELERKLFNLKDKISGIDSLITAGNDGAEDGTASCGKKERYATDDGESAWNGEITPEDVIRKLENISGILVTDPHKARLDIEKVINDLRRI